MFSHLDWTPRIRLLKANDGCLRCVRFALRPDRLTEGMYFVDSFPVKLYYKDGRLFAQMQTSTRVWTVDTSDFRQGQWSRVSDFCPTCFLPPPPPPPHHSVLVIFLLLPLPLLHCCCWSLCLLSLLIFRILFSLVYCLNIFIFDK